MASTTSSLKDDSSSVLGLESRIYLRFQPTTLNTDNQRRAGLAFSVPPSQ
ncbi:hypothetical protein BVRB_030180 [Beta vulgaris subsp. vulgaris]|uniref:Uncharacterized protein n=1 Tax=Beta vulgaris subsp. vulgaris TaxID=3555 RepID=A0A0J8AXV8_BETVV|nr:hypothetical protein BVRB_030180 [Beta vulgaris subsp. vulgaris]